MDLPSHEREEALCLLWERHAGPGCALRGQAGERIVVVSRGIRNRSAGPDYLGAVLLIDGELVTGDVEVHLRERDWFLHGHDGDAAFERVRLHLLGEARSPLLLPIVTVVASDLDRAVTDAAAPADGDSGPVATPELIAELSWGRFLRRVLAMFREDFDTDAAADTVAAIERAFLRRLYDALGYMENREPMRELAERVLLRRECLRHASLREVAILLFALSGITAERFLAAAPTERVEELRTMLSAMELSEPELSWRFEARAGNDPARRLWAAIMLTHDLIAQRGLEELIALATTSIPTGDLVRRFMVRIGSRALVGRGRATEIVVNAFFPTMLAAGIFRGEIATIESACRRYRDSPSLGSNRIIRLIESRYLRNKRLNGAFWQQGAIEFHQRYLLPDRSAISFIADRELTIPSGSPARMSSDARKP